VRAIALISLIALTCVATLSRPHTHAVEACGNSSACAACQLGSNPGEVPAQATAPVANGVELVVEQPATFAPRAQRCLERAPKQGPPAAA
jgi:hypothetical protein